MRCDVWTQTILITRFVLLNQLRRVDPVDRLIQQRDTFSFKLLISNRKIIQNSCYNDAYICTQIPRKHTTTTFRNHIGSLKSVATYQFIDWSLTKYYSTDGAARSGRFDGIPWKVVNRGGDSSLGFFWKEAWRPCEWTSRQEDGEGNHGSQPFYRNTAGNILKGHLRVLL